MSFYLLCHDSSIWHRVTLIPPCVTPIHQNQISYTWFYQQCLASLTIFFWGWLHFTNWSQWFLNKTIDVRYFCFWWFDPKSWWPIYWNEKDDAKACGTIWCDCSLWCWTRTVDTVVLSDAPSPQAAQNIVVFTQDVQHHTWIYVQLFSLMLHKNASDKFSFENCKFTIQRSKESTGR